MTCYPEQNWTLESLKRKSQKMVKAKIKTADPNIPPYICAAKWAYYAVLKKTNGSMG